MAGINGTVSWQIQPLDWNNSNLAGAFWDYRSNYLKSVNDPLRYQVLWTDSGVNEGTEPSAANYSSNNGDVVNVIFKVETSVGDGYWQELGSIKKSRDIANKKYNDGSHKHKDAHVGKTALHDVGIEIIGHSQQKYHEANRKEHSHR